MKDLEAWGMVGRRSWDAERGDKSYKVCRGHVEGVLRA